MLAIYFRTQVSSNRMRHTFALLTGPRNERIQRGAAIMDDVATRHAHLELLQLIHANADSLTARQNARHRNSPQTFPIRRATPPGLQNITELVVCSANITTPPKNHSTSKTARMEDVLAAPNAYVRATETAQYVRSQLPEALQNPKVAIVCGSGLGGLADTIEPSPKVELAYGSIPNFPKSTGMLVIEPPRK
jgi:hypothetical protein